MNKMIGSINNISIGLNKETLMISFKDLLFLSCSVMKLGSPVSFLILAALLRRRTGAYVSGRKKVQSAHAIPMIMMRRYWRGGRGYQDTLETM